MKDLWMYDLNTLQWSVANATSAATQTGDSSDVVSGESTATSDPGLLPATAGHSVTPWKHGLVVLGGHVKVCRYAHVHNLYVYTVYPRYTGTLRDPFSQPL